MRFNAGRPAPKRASMRRSRVAIVACGAAAVFPGSGAVGSSSSKPLTERLARALAVPHGAVAQSAAVALDLTAGTAVFHRHPGLSLGPASEQKLAGTFT